MGCVCGSTSCAEKRSTRQPWPNAKRSWWTLVSPHSVNRFMAHSLACCSCGVPVTRGPYTSLSQPTWSITCELASPSCLMRAMVARSTGDCAIDVVEMHKTRAQARNRLMVSSGPDSASFDCADDTGATNRRQEPSAPEPSAHSGAGAGHLERLHRRHAERLNEA